MVTRAIVIAALVAGCGSFQDPNIVIDLRVLSIKNEPADQVVDVDINHPDPTAVLAQLVAVQICALVADPGADRRLVWSMEMCPFGDNASGLRCDDSTMTFPIASGSIDDPDTTTPEPQLCATVQPNTNLINVLFDSAEADDLKGLGGIDVDVLLQIGGETDDRSNDVFASKTLRVNPRIPPQVTQNHNPTIDHISAMLDDGSGTPAMDLPLMRCLDNPAPPTLPPATKLKLTPTPSAGAAETYVAPTINGTGQTFTESLTYQWRATAGSFSRGNSGGPTQLTGNPAPIDSDYKSPDAKDVTSPMDVSLWIMQRDERLGEQWYESCVRVLPANPP